MIRKLFALALAVSGLSSMASAANVDGSDSAFRIPTTVYCTETHTNHHMVGGVTQKREATVTCNTSMPGQTLKEIAENRVSIGAPSAVASKTEKSTQFSSARAAH